MDVDRKKEQTTEIYHLLESATERTSEELKRLGLKDDMNLQELMEIFDRTSDKTFEELAMLGVFGPAVTLNQVYQLCSGVDPSGIPNSYAALSVDTITEDMQDAIPYANISFGDAVINIYAAGGCVVVTADFDQKNLFEYRRAGDIILEWITKKDSDEFSDKLLTLAIFCVPLNGQFALMFHEMVYAQGVPLEDGSYRLIMALDGNQNQVIRDSGVQLDTLKAIVDAEIDRMETERQKIAEQERRMMEDESDRNIAETFIEDNYTPDFMKDETYDETIDYESEYLSEEDEDDPDDPENGETDGDSSWMRIRK